MDNEKVYIELDKKALIEPGKKIMVKDIADVYSSRPDIKKKVENVKIENGSEEENWDYLSVVEVVEKVLDKHPNIDLNLLGSSEVMIEYKSLEEKKPFINFIKVSLVCIILFFGATIAIVNFHEDVNTRESLEKIYFIFTGVKKKDPLIMGIPYSIGIGVGMITFFSRIFSFSKRRKKEPGPMEVEIFLYDDEVEQYLTNELKKDQDS